MQPRFVPKSHDAFQFSFSSFSSFKIPLRTPSIKTTFTYTKRNYIETEYQKQDTRETKYKGKFLRRNSLSRKLNRGESTPFSTYLYNKNNVVITNVCILEGNCDIQGSISISSNSLSSNDCFKYRY